MALGKGVSWNGKYFVIPQAASRVDSSGLSRVQLGGANKLAVIGEMVGLIPPQTAKKISNPSLGLQLVHPTSDEIRRAIDLVFDPSPGSEVQGASEVYLIPVNPATLGTYTFDTKLIVTSYLYGLIANQIKSKVEDGTNSGKKISIAYLEELEVFDDVERESFSIEYTGAGSAATMTVDLVLGKLTTTCTGAVADDLDLDFASYPTIQAITDAIIAKGVYTVVVLTDSPKADLGADMDAVAAQDIKTAAYTAKSDLQAMVDVITDRSAFLTASKVTAAGAVPANEDWAYLAGGSDGVTTNTEWQSAFDLMKTMDIDLIVSITSDASIHTMGDSHCSFMSGPNGKSERRQFVGGAIQSWANEAARTTAMDALKAAFKALNSDLTVHAGLGCKLYDDAGEQVSYPAYITACAYAGIAAGGPPTLPLTRKYLRILGLEVDLRISEIEELIEAGGAVPIVDTVQNAGYVISRQVTTWNQDVDDYRVEFSVGRGADYIAEQVRARHELLVGDAGTEGLDQTILNITNAVLQAALTDEIIRSYDPKATQLRVDGTVRYVDYSAAPILPINWIFSTYHLQPTVRTIQL